MDNGTQHAARRARADERTSVAPVVGGVVVIVGVPNEVGEEDRVALVPPVAAELVEDGHEVYVESGAGEGAGWADGEYESVGCTVVADRETVFEEATVILQVQALGAVDDPHIEQYREGQVVIGMLGPYEITDEQLAALADRGVSAFALELIPRISRAQSMDALSSQASLAGYKACLLAAADLPKMFPMEMTAAGTIRPADVFVIGAGVAGLKAIATAERLGASVKAYDIRLEARRDVESLGAKFVELDLETEESGDEEGYAREMDEEFYAAQREQMQEVVPESDVLITTAAIPGGPAPELVSTEMIEAMDDGSVVVDLSAPTGGNCEPTVAGETIEHDGVTIYGPTNLPSQISHTASGQYANNVANFLENLLDEGELAFDFGDEIVNSTLLVHDGTVRNPHEDDLDEGDSDETADANEEDASGADEDEAASGDGTDAEEVSEA
ncbi:NAD(P) transhydrogenase subunit alpha [Halapricum hydrolyticum]|uniref:proton-translocating NAD(P)(+) transhydrogenase n=1 Tax=Halapricum hydrolyticum TaxID=2979991 RepID=A0AAE3IBF4_9EURY|nr:NAD(P) transhydrogenase subunit alpha [Halapricum hydrolyticum]MCU4717862.1 NAD(P) transhydrogenase subunit alpha [Halapricum hydrolyticum]MCU4727027.1 NAD(P) transhydrogenase subunit alpha [Halapricum hydrolyticum]